MTAFLVENLDSDRFFNEFHKCIVIATDEKWAEKIVRMEVFSDKDDNRKSKLKITKVDLSKEGIILKAYIC